MMSPLDDPHGFANATATVGLSFHDPAPSDFPRTPPQTKRAQPTIITTPADVQDDEIQGADTDNIFSPNDNDTTPLTKQFLQPSLKASTPSPRGQRHDRQAQRSSVQFANEDTPRRRSGTSGSRLGDDLPNLETGLGVHRNLSSASGINRLASTSGEGDSARSRSRSPSSASPLARANSMLRMMSQRVVNLSNDSDMVEQSIRRKSSVRAARLEGPPSFPAMRDYAHDGPAEPEEQSQSEAPLEKVSSVSSIHEIQKHHHIPPPPHPNPLRGNSLGIFGPENAVRKALCEVLVNPITEPIILILIVAQTVMLAVQSAPSVANDPRTNDRGISKIDYALLVLFVLYTIEIIARMIVSGFIWNPYEYSTLNRSLGLKKAVIEHGRSFFTLDRHEPERRPSATYATAPIQPSIMRSFTGMSNGAFHDIPEPEQVGHGRQQQRVRLARRAFLRHSFNRLDFVAVVSFWISFGLATVHYETDRHVYIFRMLSCLRILRLLGLTSGTSIILRSLKKAAPLLVNVAFLITFFWLLFAIVGVQSFKSSLRRTCVWDGTNIPQSGGNYTQNLAPENIQFCGGHLDLFTGAPMPWLTSDGQNGTNSHKGYLCPQGSFCVQGGNPYNGTVSFDNILQSIELVFVVISSNTFTDLMYYLTDTDYLAAALFFAAGIVIMSFWLTNLLVAVITSSFQIIRTESPGQSAFTADTREEPIAPEDEELKPRGLKGLYDRTYWLWIAVIAFDLIVQCLRSADMGPDRAHFIMNTETVVTCVLLLEIILRFLSDWRHFSHGRRNWVDLGLAIITAIIQIPSIRNSYQAYAWLTFFQIARIYRIVMAFRVTRDLIMIVWRNIIGLLNLIVFTFLLTFLAAILASQLFRGEFPADDKSGTVIHITFFDIYNSWIGMYQVLSSENWTILMYNATQFDVHWDTAWYGAIFFIMWFILANFIVLNMFIAVIQESFDVSEDEKHLHQIKAFVLQKEMGSSSQGNPSLASMFKMGRTARDALDYGPATLEQLLKETVVKEFLGEPEQPISRRSTANPLSSFPRTNLVEPGMLSAFWGKITGTNHRRDPNPFYSRPLWS